MNIKQRTPVYEEQISKTYYAEYADGEITLMDYRTYEKKSMTLEDFDKLAEFVNEVRAAEEVRLRT